LRESVGLKCNLRVQSAGYGKEQRRETDNGISTGREWLCESILLTIPNKIFFLVKLHAKYGAPDEPKPK
jgi:hypothetical protein